MSAGVEDNRATHAIAIVMPLVTEGRDNANSGPQTRFRGLGDGRSALGAALTEGSAGHSLHKPPLAGPVQVQCLRKDRRVVRIAGVVTHRQITVGTYVLETHFVAFGNRFDDPTLP